MAIWGVPLSTVRCVGGGTPQRRKLLFSFSLKAGCRPQLNYELHRPFPATLKNEIVRIRPHAAALRAGKPSRSGRWPVLRRPRRARGGRLPVHDAEHSRRTYVAFCTYAASVVLRRRRIGRSYPGEAGTMGDLYLLYSRYPVGI